MSGSECDVRLKRKLIFRPDGRPLPDERPRASVANLIGRFEQQTKRQSLTHVPPRTSSALSQISGDAAKEEVREKREWPPKSKEQQDPEDATTTAVTSELVVEAAPPKPSLPTPDASPKVEQVELPVSPPVPEAPLPAAPPAEEVQEALPSPSAEPEVPVEEPVASKPTPSRQSSLVAEAHPPASAHPVRAAGTPSKPKTIGAPRTSTTAGKPIRTPARSPPTSYHGASSAPPVSTLRASGNTKPTPVAAVHAQPKPRPSSSASVRAPITPARAKTPSTARPKTPSSTSRPKTPASGLFAPTAASLAKARNAPEHPPVPVKKQTIGTDATERLSKPTASSISKARTAAAAQSPAKTTPVKRGAAPTRGTTSARGTPVRPRGGAAVAKPREKAAIKASPSATGAVAVEAISAEIEHESHVAADSETHVERVDREEPVEEGAAQVFVHDALTHEPEEHQDHVEEVALETSPEKSEPNTHEELQNVHSEAAAHEVSDVHDVDNSDAPAEQVHTDVVNHEEISAVAVELEESDHELPPSPSPVKAHAGNDLEDLITMLEPRNPVRLSVPDDVADEIPDIDED